MLLPVGFEGTVCQLSVSSQGFQPPKLLTHAANPHAVTVRAGAKAIAIIRLATGAGSPTQSPMSFALRPQGGAALRAAATYVAPPPTLDKDHSRQHPRVPMESKGTTARHTRQ